MPLAASATPTVCLPPALVDGAAARAGLGGVGLGGQQQDFVTRKLGALPSDVAALGFDAELAVAELASSHSTTTNSHPNSPRSSGASAGAAKVWARVTCGMMQGCYRAIAGWWEFRWHSVWNQPFSLGSMIQFTKSYHR